MYIVTLKHKMWGRKGEECKSDTWLKLNCYQFKLYCYKYVLCKFPGNHKEKTYSRYTKDKEEGSKE